MCRLTQCCAGIGGQIFVIMVMNPLDGCVHTMMHLENGKRDRSVWRKILYYSYNDKCLILLYNNLVRQIWVPCIWNEDCVHKAVTVN